MSDADLLNELEPKAEEYLNRHMDVVEMWYPHDYVPYGDGRDFESEPWTPDQPTLSGVARTAFFMNLMTEDNLPSYHREIYSMFGKKDSAWMTWVHRWTAEEGRHSIVLRDYLMTTRNEDPKKIEDGRMGAMEVGYDADGKNTLRGIAYVSFQELATTDQPPQHRSLLGRPGRRPDHGADLQGREPPHAVLPGHDGCGQAHRTRTGSSRPWPTRSSTSPCPATASPTSTGWPSRSPTQASMTLRVHHDDVIWPILRKWGIFKMEGLDAAAEKRREELSQFIGGIGCPGRQVRGEAGAQA